VTCPTPPMRVRSPEEVENPVIVAANPAAEGSSSAEQNAHSDTQSSRRAVASTRAQDDVLRGVASSGQCDGHRCSTNSIPRSLRQSGPARHGPARSSFERGDAGGDGRSAGGRRDSRGEGHRRTIAERSLCPQRDHVPRDLHCTHPYLGDELASRPDPDVACHGERARPGTTFTWTVRRRSSPTRRTAGWPISGRRRLSPSAIAAAPRKAFSPRHAIAPA